MEANTFPARLRVLAVDDDRVCLKILERQLEYCNYNVTVVTDAKTALERKDGNQFDLVISDIVMPNMDGFKLLELIGLEMDLPVISKHSFVGISGFSVANNSNDYPTLTSNMCIPSSRSCRSYASILCSKILGSSRGTPFEDIANGDMKAPSGYLPLQSPELMNKPSVQLKSCSAGQINKVANKSWKTVVPSRFSDLGQNVGRPEGPTQGNNFKINQLSRLARSSRQIPTFRNEFQKKVAGIVGKVVPVEGLREQVAPFSFGNGTLSTLTPIGDSAVDSSSSNRYDLHIDNSALANSSGTRPNLKIDNSAIHELSTIDQQAVGDQVNNISELAQNAESDDLVDFLDYLVNQDFVNNGDSFIGGDSEFEP